ncbi:MAG: AlpA family phage regulatory protein [Burkholderiaceae bacterium]|nr:AlpA family phage regulatory protein [Burkholderiaceae bacterium]
MSIHTKPTHYRERDLIGRRAVTAAEAAENIARGRGLRRPHPGTPGILPFSSATLWRMVRSRRFPAPVPLGPRMTGWRCEDVEAWAARVGHTE